MKKLFILMLVFVSFSLSAQIGSEAATSFTYGIKLPNATKSDTLSAQTRIPILKDSDNNLMNIYVPLEDLGAYVSGILWGNISGTLSDQTDLQAALDLKAPLASPTFTGTVSGIDKTMVGLGNVDNTSDLNKPISTATQTALDLKADDTSVVHLAGTETITGQKDFTSFIGLTTTTTGAGFGIQSSLTGSGSSYFGTNDGTGQIIRLQLNSATGRGIVVDGTATSSGNLFVGQNNAANTFTVSKLGNITGNSFIKTGGTSSQFLKADGSIDSNSYLLSSSYTAADVLSKLLTVDGSGSGLDADMLDGVHGSSFLRADAEATKTAGNLRLNNFLNLRLGTSTKSNIYADATNSFWQLSSGNLIIQDGVVTRVTFDRTTGDITAGGNATANSFIRSGGTNQQALLADGTTKTVPKVYTALISQTGTSAPTATVLENTLGGTVVWSYSSVGNYTATLTGVFTANKTAVFFGNTTTYTVISGSRSSSDAVNVSTIRTDLTATEDYSNGLLAATPIKIEVYP